MRPKARILTRTTSKRLEFRHATPNRGSTGDILRTCGEMRAGRPQIWQRLCLRDENFRLACVLYSLCCRSHEFLFFEKLKTYFSGAERHAQVLQERPSLIVRSAVVTIVTFIPLSLSTFA